MTLVFLLEKEYMSQAHDYFRTEKDKQDVMSLIWVDSGYPKRPITLSNIRGVRFFPWHNNTYEGWFVDAVFVDHVEVWFVVDTSGGFSDINWHIEQIS